MFTLTHDRLSFDDTQLPDFVESISNHLYGKRVILKDSIASGDYKILKFTNGFRAYVSNYVLHQDFKLELDSSKEGYVALHINQIQAGAECSITLNGKTVSYDDKIITSIFLTGGSESFILSGSKDACVNRLKIIIPKTWLSKNLASFDESLLNDYFSLQEERLYWDALDNTYRSMVDKIMNTEDNSYYLSITQNIAAVIAERFFNRLHIKMQKNQRGNERSSKTA